VTDIVDDAQAAESAFLAGALERAGGGWAGPVPVKINGHTCCAECREPIAFARLAAIPGVGLCRNCAEELEAITGGW